MATMTIANVPDDLYEKLKKRAADRGLRIDDEAILCIRQALQSPRIDPEAFLARLEALHRRESPPPP